MLFSRSGSTANACKMCLGALDLFVPCSHPLTHTRSHTHMSNNNCLPPESADTRQPAMCAGIVNLLLSLSHHFSSLRQTLLPFPRRQVG